MRPDNIHESPSPESIHQAKKACERISKAAESQDKYSSLKEISAQLDEPLAQVHVFARGTNLPHNLTTMIDSLAGLNAICIENGTITKLKDTEGTEDTVQEVEVEIDIADRIYQY